MKHSGDAIISAGDMSADITSEVVDVRQVYSLVISSVYAGSSPTGDIIVQASVDGTTYHNIDTNSISATGQDFVQLDVVPWQYIRVFWDFSSGTGSLTTKFSGKGS